MQITERVEEVLANETIVALRLNHFTQPLFCPLFCMRDGRKLGEIRTVGQDFETRAYPMLGRTNLLVAIARRGLMIEEVQVYNLKTLYIQNIIALPNDMCLNPHTGPSGPSLLHYAYQLQFCTRPNLHSGQSSSSSSVSQPCHPAVLDPVARSVKVYTDIDSTSASVFVM
ncbi:hypothetical protein HK097_010987, partial [Rhizophlyctis rosea]